jgi:two-component SAPR family response regulator
MVDPTKHRVLIVEDEYMLAMDLAQVLSEHHVDVIGPVPSVSDAILLIERDPAIDAAVLDVNLSGESVFPVAEVLQARSIPFVFTTGYERSALPTRYKDVVCCEKPFDAEAIARAIDSQIQH